jgi:hypothetical protein
MSGAAGLSPRCALCGESLDATESNVGIPDLLIEMHEACYRLHVESERQRQHPKCSNL